MDALNEDLDDAGVAQKDTRNSLPGPFEIEPPIQSDTSILASFAGADLIDKDRIVFFDPIE